MTASLGSVSSSRRPSLGLHRYGPVLGAPGAMQMLAGAFVGRTGQFGMNLAVLLSVHAATGSFGVAGTVVGAMTAGTALARALQGRLIDRVGATRGLLIPLAPFLVACAALDAATAAHARLALVLPLAAAVGASLPAVAGITRTLWVVVVPDAAHRTPAFSLDAMIVEAAGMIGPALAGLLATIVSPSIGLGALVALTAAGTLMLAACRAARLPPQRAPRTRTADLLRPLLAPGAMLLLIGLVAGGIEVSVAAFAAARHAAAATGPLLACWAVGSMVGGLWYGSRAWRARAQTRLLALLAFATLVSAAFPLAPSVLALGLLLGISGLALAPALTTLYVLIDDHAPRERLAEVFAVLTSAIPAGYALGTVLAGWTVASSGPRAGLALGAGACALALLTAAHAARTTAA